MDLTLAASVDEFFHEVVTDALSAVDLDASEPASWYLVGLLGEMTRARLTDEPLGPKLAQAGVDAGERVKTLKQVGDTIALRGGLLRRVAQPLAGRRRLLRRHRPERLCAARAVASAPQKTLTEVYEELAEKFPRFVDVLAEVRKRTAIAELNATTDVGKLYEIWLRTRDEWIEKKLRALGVLVDVDHKVIQ